MIISQQQLRHCFNIYARIIFNTAQLPLALSHWFFTRQQKIVFMFFFVHIHVIAKIMSYIDTEKDTKQIKIILRLVMRKTHERKRVWRFCVDNFFTVSYFSLICFPISLWKDRHWQENIDFFLKSHTKTIETWNFRLTSHLIRQFRCHFCSVCWWINVRLQEKSNCLN